MSNEHAAVVIAPEIDFAALVGCDRGTSAWRIRQTGEALIRRFAPKPTS